MLHGLETNHVEQHVDPLAPGAAIKTEEPTVIVERLTAAQKPVEIRFLRQIAYGSLGFDILRPLAEDRDATGGRLEEP